MLWKNPSPTRCYASPLTTRIQNIPVAIDPDGSVYKASDGTIISPILKKPDWDGECASPVLDGQGNFYLVSRNGFGKAKLPATADEEAAMPKVEALSAVDQDVLSALLNLGCARPHAEAAVRKAKAAGAPAEFEPLFRKALELVR